MSSRPIQSYEECVRNHIKYRGSVQVLSAIRFLFERYSNIGQFLGVAKDIKTNFGGIITPDVSSYYDNPQLGKVGLFFELKWSITHNTAKDYVEDLKYVSAQWKIGSENIIVNDIVLICHLDDYSVISEVIKGLNIPEYDFLFREGFSVWGWEITHPKVSQEVEQMRFFKIYGAVRNATLENLIQGTSGLLLPPEFLEYYSAKYLFMKDKPPIQYTMSILLLHVFPGFQKDTHRITKLTVNNDLIDLISERTKVFFPEQLRRLWIREALDMFKKINYEIILPLRRTKLSVEEHICKRLWAFFKPKYRYRSTRFRRVRVKPSERNTRLNNF